MLPAFKAFLSHRYKSPDTNLFFFDLFADYAVLQFEVDEGVTFQPLAGGAVQGVPTNVTRLERMVRGADAFVGIYPLSLTPTDSPTSAQLLQESRYFRLELDLAIRCGKPALVLYDQRYKSLLECPANFFCASFDAQEILPGQAAPSSDALRKTIADFCASVAASMKLSAIRGGAARSARVGLLLPPRDAAGAGYGPEETGVIDQALRDSGYESTLLPWPPVLGPALHTSMAALDFLVIDVGENPLAAAAAAFFHGRFVPSLRLRRGATADAGPSQLERSLYGAFTVGYPKDVVRWQTLGELDGGIRARIQVIDLPPKRIATRDHAESYFGRSAKRPVNAFLSYSGKDDAVAASIAEALSKRFQKVFNYKDGKSIRPGEPWLAEIFDQLAAASVAIPLLSDDYFASGNCEHEAREIMARRDNQRLHVVPVKLKPKVTVPAWFADIQSERLFAKHGNADALAQEIAELVDARAKGATKAPGVPI